MEEIWKDLQGHENQYQISNTGRLRTKPKIINGWVNNSGYRCYTLSRSNKKTSFLAHRLVASTFIREPKLGEQVNHLDGDKSNNSVDNLEWTTHRENHRHAWETGLHKGKADTHYRNKQSNLTWDIVNRMRELYYEENWSINKIKDKFDLKYTHVYKIVSFLTWKTDK